MKQNKITKDIVLDFQRGEEEAFIKIYRHYYRQFYYFAYTYFADQEQANDMVQNIFLQLYRQRKKLNSPEAFHVWAYKIAYAECRNQTRRKRIVEVEYNEYTSSDNYVRIDNNPKQQYDSQFIQHEIMECIKQLSQDNQMIAVMRFYEELSIKEIASILEVPEGTVKSKVSRIKKELKEGLKQKGISPEILYTTALPTILFSTYLVIINQITISTDITTIKKIITVPASGGVVNKLIGLFQKKQIIAAVASVAIGTVGYSVLINQNSTEVKPTQAKTEQKTVAVPCYIIQVDYSTEFTNQPITVNVITNNDNYDTFFINGQETNMINTNGNYKISLVKDGAIIDETDINIQNIDIVHPELLASKQEGRIYTLFLADSESGINSTQIKFIMNGMQSTDFQYIEENQSIVFTLFEESTNVFKVYDFAGNERNIEIDSILE